MFDRFLFSKSPHSLFIISISFLLGMIAHAEPPAWWTEVGTDGHAVVDASLPEGDPNAVANIGQAKFMAKRALEALHEISPETATDIETALVGPGKAIPSWTAPAAGTPLAKAQFSPLLIGQLKAIADPFYTILRDMDSEWLYSQMTENGTADLDNLDYYLPWTPGAQDNKDKAIATIGQLKAIFSLRFESLQQTLTAEDEGEPDEEVTTEITNNGTLPEYIPAPGAPPPSATAASSAPRPYVIQFKKSKISLRKFGHKPLYPNSADDNRRYLNFRRRYFVTDFFKTRFQDPVWRVGHPNNNGSYTYNDFTQDFTDLLTINPLTGAATQYGRLDTEWWDTHDFPETTALPTGPMPYTPTDNQYDWFFLGNHFIPGVSWDYEIPPYDHSPGHQGDQAAYMNFEQMMTVENTLDEVMNTAIRNAPPYSSKWINGTPTASWKVRTDGMGVSYSRMIFRFKSTSSTRVPVTAKVVFTPRGGGQKEVVKTVTWNRGISSDDVKIDPATIKGKLKVEGTYHIEIGTINFQPDVDQENREAGKRIIIVADQKDLGGGHPVEAHSPELEFPGMDDSWINGSNITISKESGTGSVRFSTADGPIAIGTSNNLAATYFLSTGSQYKKDWKINGVDPGPLTLKANYRKGGYTLWTTKSITVVAGDLDIDSDNNGTIDSTIAEENIENDLKNKPGKIIIVQPDSQNNSNGVPNTTNGLAEIKVKASGFHTSNKIKFKYTGNDPTSPNSVGLIRLWRKQNGGLPTSTSAYIQPNHTYSLAELGITPDTVATFYVQAVSPIYTKTSIICEMSVDGIAVEDRVGMTLVPAQAVSRDKFLAGSLEIPTGWDSLQMEFIGPNENLGKYGSLMGGGATKIYNRVEDIMSPEDTSLQSASQKVWFVRDSTNSRKINYYTCFNSVGNVQIKLYLNNSSTAIGSIHHTLTAAQDFASTISYVDAWVKGTAFNWAGTENPPGVLATPPAVADAAAPQGEIDNLTRACLIPFFSVINQVEGLASIATGLFDGVKAGLLDDWMTVVLIKQGVLLAGDWAWQQAETKLLQWQNDPSVRSKELKQLADKICQYLVFNPFQPIRPEFSTWAGFQAQAWKTWDSIKGGVQQAWTVTSNAWASVVNGLKDWTNDFCDRMMLGAEKAHWQNSPWADDFLLADINSATRQVSYNFGYIFGYLCEQVGITYVTAGTSKIAQVATKGGVALASSLAKRTLAVVASRAHWVKKALADSSLGDALLRAAYEKGLVLCAVEPVGPTIRESVYEILEKLFSREGFDRTVYSLKHMSDDILTKPNLRKVLLQEGGEALVQRRLAQLATILGPDMDAAIAKNFLKVADEIIIVPKPDGTVDEFFEAFFRSFTGNPSQLAHADAQYYSIASLPTDGKAALKNFLSNPNAGKLWDTFDETTFFNNRVRGVLAELCIYKRFYKGLGYEHWPNAAGFDLTGPAWVQIKTTKVPENAYQLMKTAINDLVAYSPNDKPLLLHILVKEENTAMSQLKTQLQNYINNELTPAARFRFLPVKIEAFELIP